MPITTISKPWVDDYNKKLCTAEQAAALVNSGDMVCLAGGTNIPDGFAKAFSVRLLDLKDVTVIEGLAMAFYDFMKPEWKEHVTVETIFGGVVERFCMQWGTVHYIPIHLMDAARTIEALNPPILAFAATPPDENGYMNLSLGRGLLNSRVVSQISTVIVEVNPSLTWVNSDWNVHVSEVDHIIEKDTPMVEVPDIPILDVERTIAGHIVDMIPDGACLQIGIGGLPNAIGYFLKDKKDLGIHTEYLTTSAIDLLKDGIATGARKNFMPGKVISTIGIGNKDMYDFINHNDDILLMDVDYVNDPQVIGQNDNLISINNILSIDLSGQANSESMGTQQFSGTGGQVNFVRGAQISKGGKAILALNSTYVTKSGETKSRIVPMLPQGSAVTTPRTDVQYVATEYGVVNLKFQSVPKRVKLLISIAHPDFRDQLAFEAKKIGWLY